MRPGLDNGLTIEDAEIKTLEDRLQAITEQRNQLADRVQTLATENYRLRKQIESLEASAVVDRLYEQVQEDELWALQDKYDALEGELRLNHRSKVERWVRGEAPCL